MPAGELNLLLDEQLLEELDEDKPLPDELLEPGGELLLGAPDEDAGELELAGSLEEDAGEPLPEKPEGSPPEATYDEENSDIISNG